MSTVIEEILATGIVAIARLEHYEQAVEEEHLLAHVAGLGVQTGRAQASRTWRVGTG